MTTVTNLLQNPGCRSQEEQNKVTVKSKIKVSRGLGMAENRQDFTKSSVYKCSRELIVGNLKSNIKYTNLIITILQKLFYF